MPRSGSFEFIVEQATVGHTPINGKSHHSHISLCILSVDMLMFSQITYVLRQPFSIEEDSPCPLGLVFS